MEIKEITSGEVQAYEKDGSDKILRKSDRILDNAKEKLSPSEISKVNSEYFPLLVNRRIPFLMISLFLY